MSPIILWLAVAEGKEFDFSQYRLNYKSNNNNQRNNNNASISNNNSQLSHARLNRLQAQEDDFQSWSNTNSQGYRNASLNTLSFKRKRLHQEAAIEEERQREIEWNNSPSPRSRRRRNRRSRSESTTLSPKPSPTHETIIVPTIVADAISVPSPIAHIDIDVRAPTIVNQSAANAIVNEESNDDTSTGRRSANSNETHRPGPEHVINRPRSNDPYTLHPQHDYLHDIHGTYATFNLKTIEPPLLRFHHCNAKYPYNHYIASGLLHIEKHYAQLHMSLFYHMYVSDMPDLSIAPNMWISHDRQLTPRLRLFNWNPSNESYTFHVRKQHTWMVSYYI